MVTMNKIKKISRDAYFFFAKKKREISGYRIVFPHLLAFAGDAGWENLMGLSTQLCLSFHREDGAFGRGVMWKITT